MFKNKLLGFLRSIYTHPDMALVAASSFLFVFALKPFHIGLWFQTEPVVVALYIIAALSALICLFRKASVSGFAEAVQHPVVLLLLAMASLCVVQLVWVEFPAQSLFGAPEIADGIFSWFALAIFIMNAYQVWQHPEKRRPILISVVAASIIAIAMQRLITTIDWQPAKWPDFVSFIAIFLVITLIASPEKLEKFYLRRTLGLGVLIAILSNSMALWLILLGLVGLHYGLQRLRQKMADEGRFMNLARIIFIAVALSPILITLLSLYTDAMQALNWLMGHLLQVRNIKDFNFVQGSFGTRVMFNQISMNAFFDHPLHFITGYGWGSFSDILFRYIFNEGVWLYNLQGRWDPSWYVLTGSAFHPHNSFMAILLASGIGGLALFCLIPVVIIRQLPNERLFILGPLWASVFLLSSFWFMLPIALPFMAIALAASMRPPARAIAQASLKTRRLMQLASILIAVLFAGASWVEYASARGAGRLINAIQTRAPQPGDSELLRDYGRGNTHLWWIALNLSQYINTKFEHNSPATPEDVLWFNEMMGIVGTAVGTHQVGARLHGQYAFMHNDLVGLYNHPLWFDTQTDGLARWKDVILETIRDVPTRGDLALVYYSYFMERIKPTETPETNDALASRILALTDEVLKISPNDIQALWFSGLMMVRHPETSAAGLQRLYAVLDRHGEYYVPITAALKESIEATRKH